MTEKLQMSGDQPSPRFGHTITQVSKTQAILFGGAIGDTGKFNITGDTFSFDIPNLRWTKLEPNGQPPQNRAAHCALCIDNHQMIIFGGAVGGGGLADDNLYALDVKNTQQKNNQNESNGTWLQVNVVGNTPGRRYGHAMVFIKPFVLVNGGNTGAEPVNDVWCLNLEKAPYNWTKLETGECPPVRVYHSAALCSTGSANGMMVIFGGRTADQSALNDTWGLRRHRDGRWDWVRAPYKSSGDLPTHRYQHSTIFVGSLMLVLGGRSNQVGEVLPFELYDTESSDWYKFPSIQRFRHTLWFIDQFLYIHGGFDQDTPNIPTESLLRLDLASIFRPHASLTKALQTCINKGFNQKSSLTSYINQQDKNSDSKNNSNTDFGNRMELENNNNNQNYNRLPSRVGKSANSNQIRLANQVEVAQTYNANEQPEAIQLVAIDKLQEEWKRLGTGYQADNHYEQNQIQYNQNQLAQIFINVLYLPKEFFLLTTKHNFMNQFKKEDIHRLLDTVLQIFKREQMVVKLNAPIKIFGNLNGQFGDLMKLFQHFGAPAEHPEVKQDIDGFDYLFLGNYVNRGTRSVEIILLLFAFKLRYPDQFHLLRGNQEDKKMTKIFGMGDECIEKFNEDITDPNSIFSKINKVFECMPLVALVEDRILCVHGGIGQTIRSIEEIDLISRPLEIIHDPKMYEHKITLDLLWSDPVLQENKQENTPNIEHDIFGYKQIVRYGMNRIQKFMTENGLNMIIRSNEPVKEGFDNMQNSVITIFSCTDYGGTNQNSAGVLYIRKNGEITPKLINSNSGQYNVADRWINLEESLKNRPNFNGINQDIQEELRLRKRPPTPVRGTQNYI